MRRIYIYQQPEWPNFTWDDRKLLPLLAAVRHRQGTVVGKMGALGFDLTGQANFEILTREVIKSAAIEGEVLNREQVRSSLARQLGLAIPGLVPADRNVDGVVEMMLDATRNFTQPLTRERLWGWHNALFPGGYSGMYKIMVGCWRDDSTGPMQVVSGALGKEKVHFQAPDAINIDKEMQQFLQWFNNPPTTDLVIKAAVAHLWFVTLHPFEDGNGRIARAITEMVLARSDGQPSRFYSMSDQIRNERQAYYDILEQSQQGSLDITAWLEWFLNCLQQALVASETLLERVVFKHDFWLKNSQKITNDRQRKVLNKLLDGFTGKLTTRKWARITRCSPDTALRDIQDLIDKRILYKLPAGGRSTAYDLVRE